MKRFVAFFEDEHAVVAACADARKRGLTVDDVYSPYALHGVDEAMGLKPSRLSFVCFFAGLSGLVLMLTFEWWTSAVSWPLDVGGKPFNSLPAFIPVTFEFTVLCASLITVAALLARARLWPGSARKALPGVTTDRFALSLTAGAGFNEPIARQLCSAHGAVEARFVEEAAP